jgi:hypothetical protein
MTHCSDTLGIPSYSYTKFPVHACTVPCMHESIILPCTNSCYHTWAYGVGCPKGEKMTTGHPLYGQATPETAIRPFQGWPTHMA